MKARNKETGEVCEVYWNMCDFGRMCEASDRPKPKEFAPCCGYNAVVDDYDFDPNNDGNWIDGLEYIHAKKR